MSKSYNIISMAGAVLLLAGAVLQITRWELAPYLYTLGAVMFGYVQVLSGIVMPQWSFHLPSVSLLQTYQ